MVKVLNVPVFEGWNKNVHLIYSFSIWKKKIKNQKLSSLDFQLD